jgi:hypothetical protein
VFEAAAKTTILPGDGAEVWLLFSMRIRLGGDQEQADNRFSTAFWPLGGPTPAFRRAADGRC